MTFAVGNGRGVMTALALGASLFSPKTVLVVVVDVGGLGGKPRHVSRHRRLRNKEPELRELRLDTPSGSSTERTRATICEAPPRMLGPAALIARVPSETSYFQ